MLTNNITQAAQIWPSIEKVLFVPHTESEYDQLVAVLDELIDIVGEDESHPLASLMEIIGILVARFEDANIPEITDF